MADLASNGGIVDMEHDWPLGNQARSRSARFHIGPKRDSNEDTIIDLEGKSVIVLAWPRCMNTLSFMILMQ